MFPLEKLASAFSWADWLRSPWIALGRHVLVLELDDETVGAALCANEHQHLRGSSAYGSRDLHLVHLVNSQEAVLHGFHGRHGRLDLVTDGVAEPPTHEPVDVVVERRGEQHRLVRSLDAPQQPVHLGQEAHIGHPVGLVQDHHLDIADGHLSALAQVDQATRGGDHHVDTLAQLLHLAVDVGSAVDDDDAALDGGREERVHVGDLHRELTCRYQHEGPRTAPAPLPTRINKGSPNASVLPDPVLAFPHTSRPAVASGMVKDWTGKGR